MSAVYLGLLFLFRALMMDNQVARQIILILRSMSESEIPSLWGEAPARATFGPSYELKATSCGPTTHFVESDRLRAKDDAWRGENVEKRPVRGRCRTAPPAARGLQRRGGKRGRAGSQGGRCRAARLPSSSALDRPPPPAWEQYLGGRAAAAMAYGRPPAAAAQAQPPPQQQHPRGPPFYEPTLLSLLTCT